MRLLPDDSSPWRTQHMRPPSTGILLLNYVLPGYSGADLSGRATCSAGGKMPVSLVELREQARLLEAELVRQAVVSDSTDTKAGVAVGFAGLLVGLLVQVKVANVTLHRAVVVALVAAGFGVLAAFPRGFQSPDPDITAALFERLPEIEATTLLNGVRLRNINANHSITESKRILLTITVVVLVASIVMSGLAVK